MLVKPDESYRLKIKKEDKVEVFFPIEDISGLWLKAILSSLVFNDSYRMMTLLGLETTDDFDQEILDFLKKYIEDFDSGESEKVDPEEAELKIDDTLTDISKTNEVLDEEEKEESLDDVLTKRFYRPNQLLSFEVCQFGPCYKIEQNGVRIYFDRENLNIRFIELNSTDNENPVQFSIKFDNYQKIGGRYNFPKNITYEGLNQKYLIKIDSYYLSRKLPRFKRNDIPELSLDQIFSI